MANRLAQESSPYLRQHADNPVDWYPWGEEALARARAENRPILLSIGYSACHWCHVMAHESFADPATARLMNERFVCVKVDREEMPDLDAIYQQALQLMGQGGGWPLTMFLTPELVPFFGGTYFPPVEGYGRPAFPRLLRALAEAYHREPEAVAGNAAQVRRGLAVLAAETEGAPTPARAPLGPDGPAQAARRLAERLDPRHGGFDGAPKFPQAAALGLLLRHARRPVGGAADADEAAAAMAAGVRLTLARMAAGGIYDHLGGGFARYATDAEWRVPHFEKMTYDNAQLLRLYLDAARALGEPRFAQVARETAAYLLRDLRHPAGWFYTAQDADSEGVEGRYYLWTRDELAAALDPEAAALVARCYDVTAAGNWRDPHGQAPAGASILTRVAEPRDAAEAARLEAARATLLAARRRRVPPATDDKVLAGLNGLVIGALAEAGLALGEPAFVAAATTAAELVLTEMRAADGRLRRVWHGGAARLPGTLEDHVFVADGLITLAEATGAGRWLEAAAALVDLALERFYDPDTATFYLTAPEDGHLIQRPTASLDGPLPSGLGTSLACLVRLGEAGRPRYLAVAREVAAAHAAAAARQPFAYASFWSGVDLLLAGTTTVVLAGDDVTPLAAAAGAAYLPHRLLVRAAGAPAFLGDLVAGKTPVGGRAAAYVCRHGACQAPVTDPEALRALLAGA